MKNLGTILSAIALVGVIYLLVQGNDSNAETTVQMPAKAEGELRLAYVNTDTLLSKYELHKELKLQLEEKAKEIEQSLADKTAAFQENFKYLEQQAGSMTQEQIQQTQMELQQIQQQILQYRDERTQELVQEEQKLVELIREDMDAIIDSLKVEQGYDFIFSFDQASNLLGANPAFDITDIVVKALNETYAAKKESEE